jgi:hypothetical protein
MLIERAFDGTCAALQYMSINHSGFDIFVAEKLLDGADIVAIL